MGKRIEMDLTEKENSSRSALRGGCGCGRQHGVQG